MTLYLVRARLRRDVQVAALAPLLLPERDGDRAMAAHRLVWSLMPPDAAATRDFLWREEAPGKFMLLIRRGLESSALFDVGCKPFEPALAPGDRLHFVLRANPTVAYHRSDGGRGRRADVVMHALYPTPGKPSGSSRGPRAEIRPGLIAEAGGAWLARLGLAHGFALDDAALAVDGYERLRIPRRGDQRPIQLSTLDFAGTLTVTDPAAFVARLGAGFGRGRAFGCGLMLIRRAARAG
jgi:CRISPR system Cascade subunit CasE